MRAPVRIDFAGGWTDVPDFAGREGGAVLNAAIDRYVDGWTCWDERGFTMRFRLDLPPDSHLGSSSAIDLAWLKLTFALIGERRSAAELAETSFRLERLLGQKGGKQDDYAAALGGIHLLRFGGADDPVGIEPIALPEALRRDLEARLALAFAGPPEEGSSALHEEVWRRYRADDEATAAALRWLRDLVEPCQEAMTAGDWAALGQNLDETTETVKRLHPGLVTQRMERLFALARRAGAIGAKGCGAGGGGYLLFLCGDGRRDAVARALAAEGADPLPFRFAPREMET